MRALLLGLLFWANTLFAETAEITSGEHGDFTRLFIPLASSEPWSMTQEGTRVFLAVQGDFSVTGVFDKINKDRVRTVETTPQGIVIHLGCECAARAFDVTGLGVGIDIHRSAKKVKLPLFNSKNDLQIVHFPLLIPETKTLGVISSGEIEIDTKPEVCPADLVLEIDSQASPAVARAKLRLSNDQGGLAAWFILSGFWEEARATLEQSRDISPAEAEVLEAALTVLNAQDTRIPEALRCLDQGHFLWKFMRADAPALSARDFDPVSRFLVERVSETRPDRVLRPHPTAETLSLRSHSIPLYQPRFTDEDLSDLLAKAPAYDRDLARDILAFSERAVENTLRDWVGETAPLADALALAQDPLFRAESAQLADFCQTLATRFKDSDKPMDLLRLSLSPSPCRDHLATDQRIASRLEELGYANGL